MEKYQELLRNVGLCYQRINYVKYFNSSEDEKSEACKKERDNLSEYINSDDFNFKNFVEEKLKKVQEKEDYIMKNY
jgi:hypothetical protein